MEVCEECGARFEFIEGPKGNPIPAQKVTLLYRLTEAGKLEKFHLSGADSYFVSHFQTCSNLARFSRKPGRGR